MRVLVNKKARCRAHFLDFSGEINLSAKLIRKLPPCSTVPTAQVAKSQILHKINAIKIRTQPVKPLISEKSQKMTSNAKDRALFAFRPITSSL